MSEIRITQEQINRIMDEAEWKVMTLWGKCTVVACKLPNGFTLTESSGCVDPKNYDAKLGEEICRGKIEDQIWKLEGYALQARVGDIQ